MKISKMPLFLSAMAVLLICGILLAVLPKREFSELENRRLAEWPGTQNGMLLNGEYGKQVETYAADHFPLRDTLVSARSTLHLALGDAQQLGTLAGKNGWLFEVPPSEATRTAVLSVETLGEIAEGLHIPAYLMLVPTSAAVMQEAMPDLYANPDQQPLIEALYAKAAPMTAVDTTLFARTGDDGLYYRTDHHLTADGAVICYRQLCGALGLEPRNDFERFTAQGFRGSYYAKMPSPLIASETFSVDLPGGVRVTLDDKIAGGFLDEAALQFRNKYAALLGGTYAQATLENDAGSGSLLVISDSYANAIAPMLAAHYRRVDIIDPRYFTGDLKQLTTEAGTDTMLALFGVNTISANRSVLLMDVPEGE